MRIAELAQQADVKISTVRYYERSGILPEPERTHSGYRDYDEESLRYIRFLRRGQELGFTLAELSEFVGYSKEIRHGNVDRAALVEVAESKLRDLNERIRDLQRTRAAIEGLLGAECIDLGGACPIVEALSK